ncbi:hypothetical protein A167_00432 [Alcanivorax sp. S71-1-4]|uniref:hypothetical protein n=1 Tax=Alcanivorax sp. S71-1-4 TaxID=1177159 RepID=UPI00135C7243|nr:hypothetical protein [Alcanivorax sp. S71-1-4]KAF0810945.1 hypothetical protein A167_00432 [Alcanivorax sp. S71-1-4]
MKFLFQSHKVIKIPGKSFEDLTLREVALMIDTDSSLSPNGNEHFSSCALDEFLHNTELERSDLRQLQEEILKNIYIDVDGSKNEKINTSYLKKLSSSLKERTA